MVDTNLQSQPGWRLPAIAGLVVISITLMLWGAADAQNRAYILPGGFLVAALLALTIYLIEHRRIAGLLYQTAERLQLILNNLPLVAYEIDAEGRWVLSQGMGLQALGRKPGEVVGQSLFTFYRDKPAITKAIHQALNGKPQQIEVEVGGRIWLANYHPVTNASGKAERVFGTAIDITERIRAEQEHYKSETRLLNIIRSIPAGVCLLNNERRLLLANPAATEYLSVLSDITATEQCLTRIGQYTADQVLTPTDDGRPYEVVVKGASERLFEVASQLSQNEDAEEGYVLVIREVTEEKKMLEQARQQEQLAAVGQLAAGIAHDFNNLLTIMMGTAQILEMNEDLSAPMKKSLETIFTQGQRASDLVKQVLDFSRTRVAQHHPIRLGSFIKETVKMLERTLPETIQILTSIDKDDHTVEANLTQLQQVVTNLALNAKDAMPEGGTLHFKLSTLNLSSGQSPPWPDMEPGLWSTLMVSDTGIGMSPEVQEHIYEPFFTTKHRDRGTGLGLAQVYGIVKQHNGFIDVTSETGQGTTFTIYLPRIEAVSFKPEPQIDAPKGNGETILVVEDDKQVLAVMKHLLEYANYRIITASNGITAIDVYHQHRDEVALLLTDLVMPEMGGIELLQTLRQEDPGLPVVVMTGYSPRSTARNLPLEDIDGLLEKPPEADQVAQVIGRALAK